MEKVVLKCEIITPMFMAGTDGKTPELRPSEFKGMMRFWWRAIRAEGNIQKLQKEENSIFGGTAKGESRSEINIVLSSHLPDEKFIGDDIRNKIRNEEGCKYLLYSTFALKMQRKYIKPNYSFEIILKGLKLEALKKVLASLWLSIYLGGFGTRARRGAGNIAITDIFGNPYELNFIPDATSPERLKRWMEKNLNLIKKLIGSSATDKYTNLSNSRILIFSPKSSWIEALDFIGKKFMDFRNRNKSRLWEMASFGMPVMHDRFSVRMVPYKKVYRLSERFSSPLIFKVIKAGNIYFPLLVKLHFNEIYVGKEIKIGRKWKRERIEKIDAEAIIDEFLSQTHHYIEEELSL